MAGLPVAAVLSQLRAPSGARLPVEAAELVASFLPTGFDLLPPMRPNRRTLAQQVEFLYEYFTKHLLGEIYDEDGSEDEYILEMFADTDEDYMEMLEDTTVSVMQLVGVRGPTARATMLSIFAPPVTSSLHLMRASRLASAALRTLQNHIDGDDGMFKGVKTAELVADLVYLRELLDC
jgi:hypothetical protein